MSAQVAVDQTTHSFPAITGRWRDVFCIIENAYRDISIADSVCEGVFTFAGQTLGLGTKPNWLTTVLPEDDEWRIEWYKFYYGLDLAHAFAVTGELKYRQAWKELVQSWIVQTTVGCDSSDIAARRIQNWIYAWNIFSREREFGSDFENQIIARLAAEVRHLRCNLTAERNHRTLELYALFIAALALPELDHDGLLEFAVAELHRNLLTDVRPDGVHREQSTHYHATALRSFLGARENAVRFGVEFPVGYDERLEKACEFLLHIQRPDGLIPALSDADTGRYSDLLALAACAPSGETCASFPDGGYYIQRSGWDEGARYLVFDCGPIGDGGHGHYDLLSIEVAANGRPLIVDPGRFTYTENERRLFKGTAAHNTVCVDDLDQVEFRRGKPKGPLAQGRLLERFTAPGLDMLCGEVRSPAYEAIHTRRIFFVAGEYWLIVDSLRSSVAHKYDLRFHLTAEALNHCTRITGGIRTPDMVLLLGNNCRGGPPWPPVAQSPRISDERVATEGHPYNCSLSHGWISPRYGIKQAAPLVSVVSTGEANTDFYTLIAPRTLSAPLPGFQILSDSDPLDSGRVRIEGVGENFTEIDELSWTGSVPPAVAGGCVAVKRALMAAHPPATAGGTDRIQAGQSHVTVNTTPLLAVDPALPQRDLLLDEALMTEYLSRLVEYKIEDCERLRTKYRVGTSLRVLYKVTGNGCTYRIAARAFPRTPPVTSQTGLNAPELNTTFWIFPHDRKIKNLAVLDNIPDELTDIEGRTWTRSRIVAHAPEKSVTAQCLDDNEQIIAYAKIYAGDEGRPIFETYKAVTGKLQTPRAIAYSERHRLLLLEPVAGAPLSTENAFFQLGKALKTLHGLEPPSSLPRHTRLTPQAIARASVTIIQARPDVAALLQQLSNKLIAQYTHGNPVFLHGDVHPKNIFLNEDTLFLLDLDQAATGAAAADLGSVIAGVYCDACTGSRTWREAFALKHALLTGYDAPHDSQDLRWHIAAALLQERALRSVTRIRTATLQKLPEILRLAETVLNGGVIEN